MAGAVTWALAIPALAQADVRRSMKQLSNGT
jgi:hypothetical protein